MQNMQFTALEHLFHALTDTLGQARDKALYLQDP